MLIRVDQQVWTEQCSRMEDFRTIWDEIIGHLAHQQRVVQYIEAGSEVLHENYLEYIEKYFNNIPSIHICSITELKLLTESLAELKIYNRKMISACDSIGSLFYGEMSRENWGYFQIMINGLKWVFDALVGVSHLIKKLNVHSAFVSDMEDVTQSLKQQFEELNALLEEGQLVAVGDMIKYEIADTLKRLDDHLERMGVQE